MSRWSPQNLGSDQRPPHGFLAVLGKVAQIAAPLVGLAVGGPAGAAVGQSLGAAGGMASGPRAAAALPYQSGQLSSSVPGASNDSPSYQGMQAQIQQQAPGASPLDATDWRKQAAPFQYAGRQTPYPGSAQALGAKPSLWGGNPAARYVGMAEQLPDYLQRAEVDPGAGWGTP